MLEINDLNKTYHNGVRALRNVSLRIGTGLYGLLGPNGAGKSTLMRTVATLQQPDAGGIRFGGIDALQDPTALRRQLGYLPQDFGVYPGLSTVDLLDHLALLKGITNRSERRAQIDQLLKLTNLYPHRRRAVSGFSGGMRQRFGIAQALLGDPRLLVIDEPTAGLDPEERNRFHNLLSEVSENVVVILSTHIVEDIRRLCRRMAIMVDGCVLREGDPVEMCADLEGRVWERTISRDALPHYRTTQTVLSEQLHAGQMVVRILSESSPEPGFAAVRPGLEDVYFATLGTARLQTQEV